VYVFLRRLPSVTTHSTSSNLQFVQGIPLSTTSLTAHRQPCPANIEGHTSRRKATTKSTAGEQSHQRTLRPRQQWQALDARRFTVLPPAANPAAEDFRFTWVVVPVVVVVVSAILTRFCREGDG
jgi:hypothetical protein